VTLEGLQESGGRSISCFGRNRVQFVASGAQSHGCGADAQAREMVLGRLADQLPKFCGERRSGHGHVPRQRLHRPRPVGIAMDRCERPADLLVPNRRQPAGIAGLGAFVKE
jgi:hypothetical protein